MDINFRIKVFFSTRNDFAEKSKNLARYRSKNNFVCTIKIIMDAQTGC